MKLKIKEPILNVEKIESELKRLGKNWKWITDELRMTKPASNYWRKKRPIAAAGRIAAVLGLDAKDLIS